MCKVLNVSRGSVYYEPKKKSCDTELENLIITIFKIAEIIMGLGKLKTD